MPRAHRHQDCACTCLRCQGYWSWESRTDVSVDKRDLTNLICLFITMLVGVHIENTLGEKSFWVHSFVTNGLDSSPVLAVGDQEQERQSDWPGSTHKPVLSVGEQVLYGKTSWKDQSTRPVRATSLLSEGVPGIPRGWRPCSRQIY